MDDDRSADAKRQQDAGGASETEVAYAPPAVRDALHRARRDAAKLAPADELTFVESLPERSVEELGRRPVLRGEPFSLR